MPTAVLDGRYMNVPKHLRLCICRAGEIEDVVHYLLNCQLYQNPKEKFLGNILAALQEESPQIRVVRLLLDGDPYVTYRTALFAKVARNICANFLRAIAINCAGDCQIWSLIILYVCDFIMILLDHICILKKYDGF